MSGLINMCLSVLVIMIITIGASEGVPKNYETPSRYNNA